MHAILAPRYGTVLVCSRSSYDSHAVSYAAHTQYISQTVQRTETHARVYAFMCMIYELIAMIHIPVSLLEPKYGFSIAHVKSHYFVIQKKLEALLVSLKAQLPAGAVNTKGEFVRLVRQMVYTQMLILLHTYPSVLFNLIVHVLISMLKKITAHGRCVPILALLCNWFVHVLGER